MSLSAFEPLSPKAAGHQVRKRFGQNFLHDQQIIERIVNAVAPQTGEHIVEIGPGLGALTVPLLRRTEHLTVLELDRDLADRLPARTGFTGHLTIVQGDALRFDFKTLQQQSTPLRVVGNLPYNISTPLLFHLLQFGDLIEDMHFMLQKEVVDRITAAPNTPDYGRLSVMLQYHCVPTFLFAVPPGAFNPPPKVTSAVFRLVPHRQKPVQAKDQARFARIVSHVFTQRRKTLRNSLKNQVDMEKITALGIDPMARPENLTIEQFVMLSDCLI